MNVLFAGEHDQGELLMRVLGLEEMPAQIRRLPDGLNRTNCTLFLMHGWNRKIETRMAVNQWFERQEALSNATYELYEGHGATLKAKHVEGVRNLCDDLQDSLGSIDAIKGMVDRGSDIYSALLRLGLEYAGMRAEAHRLVSDLHAMVLSGDAENAPVKPRIAPELTSYHATSRRPVTLDNKRRAAGEHDDD